MRRFAVVFCAWLAALALSGGFCWGGEAEVIQAIIEARAAVKQFPNPSSQIPGLNAQKAYEMQVNLTKALVKKGDAIGGFKGGLTSAPAQKKFGATEPLMGPLFKRGKVAPGATIDPKGFARLFVETEVGYIVGQKISQPVKDVDSLKKMIKEVCPAIELPDLRFADMQKLKADDIVVDAVGSAKFIAGKGMPVNKVDVNQVKVTLTLDGKTINEGKGTDALGDQWQALLWLVNEAIEVGYTIEPGHLLITGALGNMLPGKPGAYVADFGTLGKISFKVK